MIEVWNEDDETENENSVSLVDSLDHHLSQHHSNNNASNNSLHFEPIEEKLLRLHAQHDSSLPYFVQNVLAEPIVIYLSQECLQKRVKECAHDLLPFCKILFAFPRLRCLAFDTILQLQTSKQILGQVAARMFAEVHVALFHAAKSNEQELPTQLLYMTEKIGQFFATESEQVFDLLSSILSAAKLLQNDTLFVQLIDKILGSKWPSNYFLTFLNIFTEVPMSDDDNVRSKLIEKILQHATPSALDMGDRPGLVKSLLQLAEHFKQVEYVHVLKQVFYDLASDNLIRLNMHFVIEMSLSHSPYLLKLVFVDIKGL